MIRSLCAFAVLLSGLDPNAFAAAGAAVHFPVEYHKLPNGLKVVFSEDHTAPVVTVAVYYKIGFRVEPKDRTGFAHLFEHMMFQGSANLGKMEFIRLVESNGGILNGSTRFDFTNYYETLPSNKLETALWAESDRMRGLAITDANLKNQQGVVGNEVKVNVLNRPYGGFPWLDLPQIANTNYYNAHNFYGDLKDIEAAILSDVQEFFKTYYAPNNAALALVGDFAPGEAKGWVEKYFASIPAHEQPAPADLTEPKQEKEKRVTKEDKLANRPALAFAYHMPDRNTPEYYAMGLWDQLLIQGDDSLLRQELVKKRALTGSVEGGINLLGNMFNYQGPMLWMGDVYYDSGTSADQIIKAIDTVMDRVRSEGATDAMLDRARVKLKSEFYNAVDSGFARADMLASLALFDDRPQRINEIEQKFADVTPALMKKTADDVFQTSNRTILQITPGAAAPAVQKGVN
jgi:zinc protease